MATPGERDRERAWVGRRARVREGDRETKTTSDRNASSRPACDASAGLSTHSASYTPPASVDNSADGPLPNKQGTPDKVFSTGSSGRNQALTV